MNPLLITLAVILATVIAWTVWTVQSPSGESRPLWLDLVISGCILTILWGGTRLAKAFTEGATGGIAQLLGMGIFMLGFLALFTLWHKPLFAFISSPITDAFTGGSKKIQPKPFYSHAIAHRRNHHHQAALDAVDDQLVLFPNNAEGWLLKAEIQAKDMRDPQAALATIRTFIPSVSPDDMPEVLLREADLLLFELRQPDEARHSLQRIIIGFPGSGGAQIAQQRLAHFPSNSAWIDGNPLGDRESLAVVQHEEKLGLTDDLGASLVAATSNPEDERMQLVCELAEFPDDPVRRERLARLLATELNRPDLAHEEIERLVRAPGAGERNIIRWLNLAADIHLKSPYGVPAARLTLERIIERFPGSAGATQASQRLSTLSLGSRATRTEPTLRMGSYEEKPGLQTERRFSATRANLPGLYRDPEAPLDPPDLTESRADESKAAPDARG
jgi:hypothetical protein